MALAALVAGRVFSQPIVRPNASAFNGGYSGALAYGGGKFVAGGVNGKIAYADW